MHCLDKQEPLQRHQFSESGGSAEAQQVIMMMMMMMMMMIVMMLELEKQFKKSKYWSIILIETFCLRLDIQTSVSAGQKGTRWPQVCASQKLR